MLQVETIVMDCGESLSRVGFCSDLAPRSVIKSIIGVAHLPAPINYNQKYEKHEFVGNEIQQNKRKIWRIKSPMIDGVVVNWEYMMKIWHSCYYQQLQVYPRQHPIILTQTSSNPKENRQKMLQIMFQSFEVSSFFMQNQAVLSLLASGRTTGCVLDCGYGRTYIVPVYQGYTLKPLIGRNNIGGRYITNYMKSLVEQLDDECKKRQKNVYMQGQGNIKLEEWNQIEIARDIKEKFCFTALDYEIQINSYKINSEDIDKVYTLPDGKKITIGHQRFKCPQILFKPYLAGIQIIGIHQKFNESILNCDIDLRKELYNNILLSGGTMMIPNMDLRLRQEIIALKPPASNIKVIKPAYPNNSAWIGGTILGNVSTFSSMAISLEEYLQTGSHIVNRKCF